MKIKINTLILSALMGLFIMACNEDDANFSGPYRLNVVGSGEVRPESSQEYTIGDFSNPEAYSWTVDGPATIAGSSTGNTIMVNFGAVGNVTISVTNGSDANGTIVVEVADTEPVVTTSFSKKGTGVLKNGATDTVYFEFDAPLSVSPTFVMNTDSSGFAKELAFTSGTLGSLVKVDDDSYYALYTAGTGNGTPEGRFSNIKSTDTYGGVSIDEAFIWLYRVDNIAPVADLSYSSEMVNDSTTITVTAAFSEEMMGANLVSFSGAGVANETDTLKATSDPLVYTYSYTLNGNGNGTLNVSISSSSDLGGNALAVVNGGSMVQVDNIDPTMLLADAVAGGSGVATIQITSSENGTGWYMILEDGADAPTEAADFEGSNSLSLTTFVMSSEAISLAPGDYDVYFISGDNAGNYSGISMVDLTVN